MKTNIPKVSVIIPNYNHARYLGRRIDSVLGQTYRDFEVIFLDDCSTDESRSIISEYAGHPGVRIEFNEKNSGSTFKQWNKGVRMSRGRYVWIAESDDYADTRFLERLVAVLEAEPENTFVYCRSWCVDSDGRASGFIDPELPDEVRHRWTADYCADGNTECRNYMTRCNTVPNASAVLFRKTTYERVGGADESLRLCGDWKLWASMAMRGRIAYVAEPLNYYRLHDASVRNWSKEVGVWTTEGSQVWQWIRYQIEFPADFWVPVLMSTHVPLLVKREILQRAWAVDPHPVRNALRPALRNVRLKFLRHFRELRSAVRNTGRLNFK
jgi:glycosyltransferase involved in cell wall biosynthesis